MGLVNKKLSPGEIAAAYYHVFGGCDDWTLLYAIADGRKGKQVYEINRTSVSRWRNMEKITGLVEKLKIERDRAKIGPGENETADKGQADSVHTEKGLNLKSAKFVDYSSPAAQQAKLNELVNTASDPGEALDALKVIIQGQKADREAAKEGRAQRVYLPLTCDGCPLYQKARKKGGK